MTQKSLAGALLLILGSVACGQVAVASEPIGDVDLVEVWAYGTPPGAERSAIFRGHKVVGDETLETVSTAYLHITFVDGTTLALGESTVLVLDEFVYDSNASESMVAEFSNGLFHLVSGAMDDQNVVIETPAFAIGLRGTEIVVRVGDDGTTDLAVRGGSATATPTAGGEAVIVNAGQTVTGKPDDPVLVLVDGLPAFATTELPTGHSGRHNLGGGSNSTGGGDLGFGGMGGDSGSMGGGGTRGVK